MKCQRWCLFCGQQRKLTKEHFWPAWIGGQLSSSLNPTHVLRVVTREGLSKPSVLETERQGAVTTKKIEVVCAKCNNGWMSRLETKVKGPLLGLAQGIYTDLSLKETSDLARWIAVKAIVAEHDRRDSALTPIADRYDLFNTSAIPSHFRIWIGRHALPLETWFIRDSKTVSLSATGIDPALPKDLHRNIQLVAFVIGKLFVVLVGNRVADLNPNCLDPTGMKNIWPEQGPADLALLPSLDMAAVSAICESLKRLSNPTNTVYGGPIPREPV